MLRTVKPKNARSKRALQAREPKEVEDPRVAIFVKGTHAGEKVTAVMKELMALKRPHAISFSKKNAVRPFEDATSLEFWAQKNDASLFVVGQSTKKRPDGLTFVRMYDHRVLDMCEVGVEGWKSMADFKTPKATPGHKPLLHFASELFDTHPRFIQLKSMLMDFFNGEVIDAIHLAGLEHVISISLGPTPPSLNAAMSTLQATGAPNEDLLSLPKVHVRSYMIRLLASGTRVPRVELTPMGPSLDLTLRRHTDADPEMWKQAMKRPKLRKQDVEKGVGKKRKNLDVDEMGDLRGRIHVGKQDLGKLQTRKMKGLKPGREEAVGDDENEGESGRDSEGEDEGRSRKKRREV
ncbi:Brix-domain-containing protein [Dichomitus squalens]|uniref:Ribosome production factor 2 homolog n=1 Tax=Dichomitus squalens TaxID=114155 RepID=A0A4Q9PQ56_9APHY|nr:Brix-domain-containing protein [Dichomitus squalens]TBU44962.1 Brix-domain-containing protein [Dichomitus squalens]TBU56482.1 Brix-domain-containing protein [Dichomitus squalens]